MPDQSETYSPEEQPRIEGREEAGRRPPISIMDILVLTLVVGVLAAIIVPNTRHTHCGASGPLRACKSNLKNLGTAMEMYSTDYDGKYPPVGRVGELLVPNYLKTVPECPVEGGSYRFQDGPNAPYNTQNYRDYYFIECRGESHAAVGVPANYPQYNGIVGLIER